MFINAMTPLNAGMYLSKQRSVLRFTRTEGCWFQIQSLSTGLFLVASGWDVIFSHRVPPHNGMWLADQFELKFYPGWEKISDAPLCILTFSNGALGAFQEVADVDVKGSIIPMVWPFSYLDYAVFRITPAPPTQ
jgi:hypothetical protein